MLFIFQINFLNLEFSKTLFCLNVHTELAVYTISTPTNLVLIWILLVAFNYTRVACLLEYFEYIDEYVVRLHIKSSVV